MDLGWFRAYFQTKPYNKTTMNGDEWDCFNGRFFGGGGGIASEKSPAGVGSTWNVQEIPGTFKAKQRHLEMAVCQNLVPLVNIKIAGKWMFIPLKMVLIGIDPYPHQKLRSVVHTIHQKHAQHLWTSVNHCPFVDGSVPLGLNQGFPGRFMKFRLRSAACATWRSCPGSLHVSRNPRLPKQWISLTYWCLAGNEGMIHNH